MKPELTAEEILEKKILKKELLIIRKQKELKDLKRELANQHSKQLKFKIDLSEMTK